MVNMCETRGVGRHGVWGDMGCRETRVSGGMDMGCRETLGVRRRGVSGGVGCREMQVLGDMGVGRHRGGGVHVCVSWSIT